MENRVYTIKSALTDYFQGAIGESTLRSLIRTGRIKHQRAGTIILIREAWLDAYMESEVDSAQAPTGVRAAR